MKGVKSAVDSCHGSKLGGKGKNRGQVLIHEFHQKKNFRKRFLFFHKEILLVVAVSRQIIMSFLCDLCASTVKSSQLFLGPRLRGDDEKISRLKPLPQTNKALGNRL